MATPNLKALIADVAVQTSTYDGVIELLEGLQIHIDDALDAARAKGATVEQLDLFTDLSAAIASDAHELAMAVDKNTKDE